MVWSDDFVHRSIGGLRFPFEISVVRRILVHPLQKGCRFVQVDQSCKKAACMRVPPVRKAGL